MFNEINGTALSSSDYKNHVLLYNRCLTLDMLNKGILTDEATANAVAEWCKDCLKGRKTLSGSFRADPRLDALDRVTVISKYSSSPVYITNIKYDYNGAFRGTYEGRVAE